MVELPPRIIAIRDLDLAARRASLAREWLVTNGLGGYASGTIGGAPSRRYHGVLIAALPAPYGRRMLLTDVLEQVSIAGGPWQTLADADGERLVEFRLELGLPVWRYDVDGLAIEKRVVSLHHQNTVHVIYRALDASSIARMRVAIVPHNRSHDAPADMPLPKPYTIASREHGYEVAVDDLPVLRLAAVPGGHSFVDAPAELPERGYAVEASRGYDQRAAPWTPGYFALDLPPDSAVALLASTEVWDVATALSPLEALHSEQERRRKLLVTAVPAARDAPAGELVLAADQFLVKPAGRAAETARMRAEGDEGRTVIAGYHWFTDWGRDTMIALEGLTLVTGRPSDAAHILRTFAHAIRDGLLPNLFPEGAQEGLYHTADATLWLFHAIHRYVERTGDRDLLAALLPRLVDVAERHLQGTRFNIGVDPDDGLLRQGAPNYQLTWMDAKVDDWVVTPRRGKAVEINALWYNALCLLADWLRAAQRGREAEMWAAHAERTRLSFNRRFWNEDAQYLYDVVDGENGDDDACRPNQVLAIGLPHAVLSHQHWNAVLASVRERLLTPFGLRSLAPGHSDYCGRYEGDIYARDAAYHQGTVWGWLIGPFIDAWLKAYPEERERARGFLDAFAAHLSDHGVGSISEIFDAEPPYTPRGCIAQAWSVAEVLRCLEKVRSYG